MLAILQKAKIGLLFFALFFLIYPLATARGEDNYSVGQSPAVGESTNDLQNRLDDNRKEQERIRKLLDETKQKKVTLTNEIVYQDNQIKLTELKIQETEQAC